MKNKIAFVSLGCDKNTVDTEIMLRILADRGYEITEDETEADALFVNTCGFILDAKEESIQTLIEKGTLKETAHLKALIATGCLAQRYSKEIQEQLPEVDAVLGTGSYEDIADICDQLLGGPEAADSDRPAACLMDLRDPDLRDLGYRKRILTTPGFYGYLKIAEGCSNHCTYCAIPRIRGPYHSRRMEDILQEARDMADLGVREINVVAQDITKYGLDLYGRHALAELLRKIAEIPEIRWIRLMYAYPEDITPELIAVMQEEPKIAHYIDIPIQHCSDRILRMMARHHTKEKLLQVIADLRRAMPDITIRTTLITGFPGETEQEFEEMRDFIEEIRFDRLGVFRYSREEDTPAARMPEQVPAREKRRRERILMGCQQKISREIAESLVGREMDVFIEGEMPDEQKEDGTRVYVGRTYRDAPDIDGYFFLESKKSLMSGDYVRGVVTQATDYDLTGVEKDVESAE